MNNYLNKTYIILDRKLNVIEANFQKVNLEKIFRSITTGKN